MKELANQIVAWLKDYAVKNNQNGFVVGVSGGVDSALVSTLCAMTGLPTYCVILPCQSKPEETKRGYIHVKWLYKKFENVYLHTIDLTRTFVEFREEVLRDYDNDLAFANTKSRLRMIALYQIACCTKSMVAGTGNKVEDFGIGFFTKYGDGGVDISPIADLLKSEVRQMCRDLGVLSELANAVPTDGLWADARSDEDAIGATYEELEWAMGWFESNTNILDWKWVADHSALTERQMKVLEIYYNRHQATMHKLLPIPTFKRS